jgi:transposase
MYDSNAWLCLWAKTGPGALAGRPLHGPSSSATQALARFVYFAERQLSLLDSEIQFLLTQVQSMPSIPDNVRGPLTGPEASSPADSRLQTAVELWDSIPGIDQLAATSLVAEIGSNMDQFPTAHHLASWAGLCPGNNVSAGKRRSGATRKGSVWLRRALCQAAWAASRTKDTYLAAQVPLTHCKEGQKRTIVAVAHSMLIIAYYLAKRQCTYQDLGADHFNRLDIRTPFRTVWSRN